MAGCGRNAAWPGGAASGSAWRFSFPRIRRQRLPLITSDVIELSHRPATFLIIRPARDQRRQTRARPGENHASRIYKKRTAALAARHVEGDRRQDLRERF